MAFLFDEFKSRDPTFLVDPGFLEVVFFCPFASPRPVKRNAAYRFWAKPPYVTAAAAPAQNNKMKHPRDPDLPGPAGKGCFIFSHGDHGVSVSADFPFADAARRSVRSFYGQYLRESGDVEYLFDRLVRPDDLHRALLRHRLMRGEQDSESGGGDIIELFKIQNKLRHAVERSLDVSVEFGGGHRVQTPLKSDGQNRPILCFYDIHSDNSVL